jgi:hypothetical protein
MFNWKNMQFIIFRVTLYLFLCINFQLNYDYSYENQSKFVSLLNYLKSYIHKTQNYFHFVYYFKNVMNNICVTLIFDTRLL